MIDEIYNMLDYSELGLASFEATFPSSGKIIVEIIFKPHSEYRITIHDIGGNPHRVSAVEIPGEFLKSQTHGGLGFQDIASRVAIWTESIETEIRSLGKRDTTLDDITAQIDQLVNENITNPEHRFDADEIERILSRLDDLERRFQLLQQEKKITENELTKLKGHIVKASEDVPILPKGIWYRLSLNRILGTLKEIAKSKEGRELLKEAVKKLVGL